MELSGGRWDKMVNCGNQICKCLLENLNIV